MRLDFPDFPQFLKLFESAFSPRLHFWYSLGLPYFLKIKFDLLLLFAVGKGGSAFHEQRLRKEDLSEYQPVILS